MDDKLTVFFVFVPEDRFEISLRGRFALNVKSYFLGKNEEKYFKILHAEMFNQHAKRLLSKFSIIFCFI